MRVELRYGRDGLAVELPDGLDLTVIRKEPMELIADPERAVATAFTRPNGCPPLGDLAKGKATVCILVCDITRPVPNGLFLRPLVETLLSSGIALRDITVLVATGLHRPNEGAELAEVIGDPWVAANVRIENHDARDSAMHVDLGFTPERRVPVKLDRRFVEADLRIATGLVEPHFMAGYSGGRKVVAPGIAHEDTIRTFHSARFMEHPRATQCVLDGNPLHEEQLAIIAMAGDVYAINTVIDENRELAFINFGEVVGSHAEAVAFAERSCVVDVHRRFKTVLTSAAGFPLDRTYYQTVKGMVTPLDIVVDGADVIIAADCSEGMGSEDFRSAQARLVEAGTDRFLAAINQKTLADIDEWQTEMQLKTTRRANVKLYSEGLARVDHALTGVDVVDSIERAVHDSVRKNNDKAVAVIPEGPYVIPRFAA